MKKKQSFLYYLNPKNVSAAIEKYGYTYRIRNTVLVYVLVLACSWTGGFVFRLSLPYICVIAVCGMAMMPKVVINSYKKAIERIVKNGGNDR